MKDLSPAVGARLETKWAAVTAGSGRCNCSHDCLPAGERLGTGRGLWGPVAGLQGLVSPSSQQICHPYAGDHNQIGSTRPGKEAFKLLILHRRVMTAQLSISPVASIDKDLGGVQRAGGGEAQGEGGGQAGGAESERGMPPK